MRSVKALCSNGAEIGPMFSGIVEEVGKVRSYDLQRMTVDASVVLQDLKVSESICVAGVCLTVVELGEGVFTVETVPETVERSNFKVLSPGDGVNLERSLALGDRIGGHMVQGHVDGRGQVLSVTPEANSVRVRIGCGLDLLRYVVEKGFIAVDGISLTITDVDNRSFEIAVIPYTLEHTTLSERPVGSEVNLEVDVTAKYVEKLAVPHLEKLGAVAS